VRLADCFLERVNIMEFMSHNNEVHAVIPVDFRITPNVEAMTDKEYENYDGEFELVMEVMGIEEVIATSKDQVALNYLRLEIISEEDEIISTETACNRLRQLYKELIKLKA